MATVPIPRRLAAACAAVLGTAFACVALAAPAAADNPPLPNDPIGSVGRVSATGGGVEFVGWAVDPNALSTNALVVGVVDGRIRVQARTDQTRPVITKQRHTGRTPGFDLTVPVGAGAHTVCLAVRDIGPGLGRVLDCVATPLGTRLSAAQQAAHSPTGHYGSIGSTASTLTVNGFAAEPDMRALPLRVVLYVDGSPAATVTTHQADASQQARGAAPLGAFRISVPVASGAHLGCVWVVDAGFGSNTFLGCAATDTRGTGAAPSAEPAANKTMVTVARNHLGYSYVFGAEGPKSFDCSGLVMFAGHKAGISTPRVSSDQFNAARLIPASHVEPGDLVFYHDSEGNVYHVGIYVSPGRTIAAIDTAQGVNYQNIYDPTATYGSFTHT